MGEENNLSRLEFEHFIAEYEAFRDTMLDDLSDLRQNIEVIQDSLNDLKKDISTRRQ